MSHGSHKNSSWKNVASIDARGRTHDSHGHLLNKNGTHTGIGREHLKSGFHSVGTKKGTNSPKSPVSVDSRGRYHGPDGKFVPNPYSTRTPSLHLKKKGRVSRSLPARSEKSVCYMRDFLQSLKNSHPRVHLAIVKGDSLAWMEHPDLVARFHHMKKGPELSVCSTNKKSFEHYWKDGKLHVVSK